MQYENHIIDLWVDLCHMGLCGKIPTISQFVTYSFDHPFTVVDANLFLQEIVDNHIKASNTHNQDSQVEKIASDDINHGIKHEFDRRTIGRLAWETPEGNAGWDTGLPNEDVKEYFCRKADRIIAYVEEIIYG